MRLPSLLALGFLAMSVPWAPGPQELGSAAIARPQQACGVDYYVNVDGICVHRPVQAYGPPIGATAKCRDGTYSFSRHHRGTCNHHGGVASWL
jgi:hypothetical protein